MIILSDRARSLFDDFFRTREKGPIRVYAVSGCHGPMLALALDRVNEEADEVEEKGGYLFCMDRQLKSLVREVDIDAGNTGFSCTPLIPLPTGAGNACASCGGGCSGCHH